MNGETLSHIVLAWIVLFYFSETIQILTYALVLMSPLFFFGYMILT